MIGSGVKRAAWTLSLAVLAGLAVWTAIRIADKPQKPAPVPETKPAFLNARWGMSPAEVEKANVQTLKEDASPSKLFTPKESVKDPSRYRILRSDFEFLGRPAKVHYLFFDDQFFTYHVFVNDSDFESLDSDMRRFLVEKFGQGYSEITEEDSPLQLVWHSRDLIVNYWIYEDDLRLSAPVTAVMGIVYRPIEESIA